MSEKNIKIRLMQAALDHVPFDGWSAATFDAAVVDSGVDPVLARAACPRGAVDLALAYHAAGDAAMVARLAGVELGAMKFRERIALAVRYRLEAADKELVRRGSALFSLPQYAADGARAIWGTAGIIWETLGDSSDDINWYTKRATLGGVYGATVLYWLGDISEGSENTWEFLDRRIENVMQFERLKAGVRDNKALSGLLAGPLAVLGRIKAPVDNAGAPGRWNRPEQEQ
jgi:ubiquinone biosynthesis protein COQ9